MDLISEKRSLRYTKLLIENFYIKFEVLKESAPFKHLLILDIINVLL